MAFISNYDDVNLEDCEEGDELFVDLIKARPWLWLKSDKNYGDQTMTENGWTEISKAMNLSVGECIKRWARIKSNYHKENMLQEKETTSGSGASKRKVWPLYERMKQLYESETQNRKTYSNIQIPGSNTNVHNISKTKKKLKKFNIVESALSQFSNTADKIINVLPQNKVNTNSIATNDPDQIFGSLVAAELDKLEFMKGCRKRKLIYKYISELP